MWWMAAGMALQAVQQIGAARAQNAVGKIQNQMQNEATKRYNKQVADQAAKSFNEISVQRSVLADQVETALAGAQRQGLQAKSARGLQAAGTDTMGASVEQNLLDVDQKVGEAQEQLLYNARISDHALNVQAQAVADGAGSSLKTETAFVKNEWGSVLGEVAANLGMSLLENKAGSGSFWKRTSRQQGIS